MKTIGILGGMSWESTVTYYQILNRQMHARFGGLTSAKVIINSLAFEEIEKCQLAGDWAKSAGILAQAALGLEKAGADIVLIATNTMHKVADEVQAAIHIPLLHIGDATGRTLQAHGFTKVGFLGTRYTLTQSFMKDRLARYGVQTLIPNDSDIEEVNRIIFKELCVGQILDASRQTYLRIINDFKAQGAQAVILGCTEIGLLISQDDTDLCVVDTTYEHAMAALQWALGEATL